MDDRLGIGGNKPPAFDALTIHVEDLFVLVSQSTAGGAVCTEEQDAALSALLDDLRAAKNETSASCEAEYRPHKAAADAVKAKWKPLIDRCDAGAAHIKSLVTPFREARQRERDETARKAREAAEKAAQEAQAAFRQADTLADRHAAEEALKASKKLTAVANRIDRSPTGLRTRHVATLTDPVAALKHYRETQADALKAWLLEQAQRDVNAGVRVIPGFDISPERKAA